MCLIDVGGIEANLDLMADGSDDEAPPEERRMLDNVNKIQLGFGLLVVGIAASLLLLDVLESGAAAGFGFIGIVLITAPGWNRNHM
jgi:hypothetical protein